MKKLINLLIIMLLSGIISAQGTENTLAGNARVKGGFGGPFFVYSQVENHNGTGAGGGGGIMYA